MARPRHCHFCVSEDNTWSASQEILLILTPEMFLVTHNSRARYHSLNSSQMDSAAGTDMDFCAKCSYRNYVNLRRERDRSIIFR